MIHDKSSPSEWAEKYTNHPTPSEMAVGKMTERKSLTLARVFFKIRA